MPDKMMKTLKMAFALLVSGAVRVFAVEEPAMLPVDRYQPMIARSPFSLATESVAPAANAGFARDWVLTGVVRLDGGEFITVVSRDLSQRFALMRGDSFNGITIAGVAWSDTAGKTRVTLKRGTEYGVVGFDEAALLERPAGAAPPAAAPSAPPAESTAPPRVAPGSGRQAPAS